MGIDWETILSCEGGAMGQAYEDLVADATLRMDRYARYDQDET